MSKELPPSRTADQYVVRFPDGMRDRIFVAARASGRSMNSEIVARLAASFEQAPVNAMDRAMMLELINQAIDARLERDSGIGAPTPKRRAKK